MYGKNRLYRRFRKPRWDGRGFADPGGRTAPNRHRTDTPRRNRNGFGICAAAIRLLACSSCGAPRPRGCIRRPRKASPAVRLRLSVYRSADKARAWSDGLPREACSSGCGGFPRSRLAVSVRRRFRCAAVGSCGTVPLRERRACACLCIAAAFFVLGFRAAYEEQHLCAADFLRTMRRRSERRGLSAACANRRRIGVHRPFFRRRAELERPCLNARTAARLSARRKRLGGISRAAPQQQGCAQLRRGQNAPRRGFS